MAEISPDVNNFAGNCRDLGSVGFLRVLKRKPASRPAIFGFWKPRSAADRRNDRVGRFRIGRRSDPPGGSGLGWVWTALSKSFQLGGLRRGFSISTLISFLITRLDVILCLYLFSLTLCALHLLFIVYAYAL